jgi:hypothetical protein
MSETKSCDAYAVYSRRLEHKSDEAAGYERKAQWVSNARLAVFAAGVVLAWLVWESKILSAWWMILPAAAFLWLLILHDRIFKAQRKSERAAALYSGGLARLEDRWAGSGDSGARFLDESHPYARDLDLFGTGTLFELLCTTSTPWGARTLSAWLLAPAPIDAVRARQQAVDELRPRIDLREKTAVLDGDIPADVEPDRLTRWAGAPPVLTSRLLRFAAFILAAVTLGLVVAWAVSWIGRLPVLVAFVIEMAFAMGLRPKVEKVIESAERPDRELGLLSQLLACLETETFQAPYLVGLQETLSRNGVPASKQIARLRRLIEKLDLRRNKFFAPLAAILLWGTQFAFAIEAWRMRSGKDVGRWLDALGELEALLALATYSYEHPDDPFPELEEEGPLFDGEGIGHPLIPEQRLVRNNVRLGGDLRLLVVSGSNMSGKSTLLRTIGTNIVLAWAGGPVRARRLKLSPLAVGASIRIVDSLQKGVSRFYVEIKRLRQIMDLSLAPSPLVFLLDEILHGTNSHDRRIGAEAVVQGLIERGALGLITTHDLALSRVADSLAPSGANVHFEDHLVDGKMIFDYRLRSGVIQKGNALELMRSVGLISHQSPVSPKLRPK